MPAAMAEPARKREARMESFIVMSWRRVEYRLDRLERIELLLIDSGILDVIREGTYNLF